jgi:hypothetical protein
MMDHGLVERLCCFEISKRLWYAEATLGYFRAYSAGWGDFTTD